MAKTKLIEYDTNAGNNTDIDSIALGEGIMAPSDVNNAIRELMAHLKDFADGTHAVNAIGVDNLNFDGNTISSTDTDGNIVLDPNGTGIVSVVSGLTPTGALTPTGGITNLIRTQVFTASGTYTPATNATKAIVHVVGAGGGGGGTAGTASGEAAAAGGGGGGSVIISDVIDVSGGSYTSTITIGAAGVGANDTDGTAGGDTTYADGTITLTAGGGNGGTRQADTAIFKNAAGGSGSANTVTGHTPIVNTKGEGGYTGLTFADADVSNMIISGAGGNAYPYGSGGVERQRTASGSANGVAADGYGGGGSGSVSHSTTGAKAGGDGTDGVVIVFEYL